MENKKLVYVVCPHKKQPIGGIKQLYRLVDTLNLAGYNAFIIHGKNNFRVNWFEHQTPIKYFPNLFALLYHNTRKKKKLKVPLFIKQLFISRRMPETESIIVFPEIYGPSINDLVPDHKIVVFNQNCYYSFDRFELLKKQASPYNNPNTLGCMVVSDDSLNYLNYAFPNLPIARIHLGLSQCFQYANQKKKQIAFMPRKLSEDFIQLFNIITNRNELKDWSFVAIDNMSELEVANTLKESAIFLSFNYREGFGLPPVEAMACGCYVIGYTGNAGEEYFDKQFCSPIEGRNIIEFAKEIEATVKAYEADPDQILQKGKQASDYVLANYNAQREREDTIKAWFQLTNSTDK